MDTCDWTPEDCGTNDSCTHLSRQTVELGIRVASEHFLSGTGTYTRRLHGWDVFEWCENVHAKQNKPIRLVSRQLRTIGRRMFCAFPSHIHVVNNNKNTPTDKYNCKNFRNFNSTRRGNKMTSRSSCKKRRKLNLKKLQRINLHALHSKQRTPLLPPYGTLMPCSLTFILSASWRIVSSPFLPLKKKLASNCGERSKSFCWCMCAEEKMMIYMISWQSC